MVAYTSSTDAKQGLTSAFTPIGGSLTPEQQAAINRAASLVPTTPAPPVTPTQTTSTQSPSTIPTTPSTTTTPTQTKTTDPNQDALKTAQDQRTQADAAYQAAATQVQTTISNIQSGATPLTAGELAQIDGLKQQFQTLIDKQTLVNTGASGVANIRGYQTGAAEYDPNFQIKTIGSIVSAGQAKVADLQTKEAAAIAQLTQSFKDNDIKAVKDAWDIYQKAYDEKQTTLQSTIKETQDAIKQAHDDLQKQEETYYNQVTKPLNDLAAEAAKNGAPSAVIQAIQSSGDVGTAIAASGNWLQTATGDLGRYLDYSRQAQASGHAVQSYDLWLKADKAQTAKDKANEAYATAYASAKGKAAGEAAAGTVTLKPLTEAQAKDLTYAQRGTQAETIINNLSNSVVSMNPASYALQLQAEGNDVLNQYVSTDVRNIKQAERNFLAAVLRRESGAQISESEFAQGMLQYFPRPGDDPATLEQKTQNRNTAIDSFKQNVPDYDTRIASTPSTSTTLQQAETLATQKVADWATKSPQNQSAYEQAKKIFPNATATELAQQLGI